MNKGRHEANKTYPPNRIMWSYRVRPTTAKAKICLLSDLASIEAVYILFLFSGRYKWMPELSWFPGDLTVVFFALVLVAVGWNIVSRKLKPPQITFTVFMFVVFTELVAASYFWSSLNPLNEDKALRYLIFTAPAFFLSTVLAQEAERRQRLVRLMTWFSITLVGYYFYYRYICGINLTGVEDIAAGTVPEGSVNYLEISSHAGILFVVSLVYAAVHPWRRLWLSMLGIAGSLLSLLIIGGRGPLIMSLLSVPMLVLGLIFGPRHSVSSLARLSVVAFVITIGAISSNLVAELAHDNQFRTLERLDAQVSGEDTGSMDERAQGRSLALRLWLERPLLGWGVGEFRVYDSYLQYPHNLVLEVLAEIGIVGGVLLALVIFPAVSRSIRVARNPNSRAADIVLALLFITDLIYHATVTGYLADDRIFFSYLAIVLMGVGRRVSTSV